MSEHVCHQQSIIELIRERLGEGDVSLNTIKMQLDQILQQTTKTNGRVTKLETDAISEKIKPRFSWSACATFLGTVGMILGFALAITCGGK